MLYKNGETGYYVPFFQVRHSYICGGVPEWPKGTDCKSVGSAFEGSNPSPSTRDLFIRTGGNSSIGRASAFQAEGREFDSRFPLHICIAAGAHIAQLVERILGKDEVTGSTPVVGSNGHWS